MNSPHTPHISHTPFSPPACTGGEARLDGWQLAWAQIAGSGHAVLEDRLAHRAVHFRGDRCPALFCALADGVGSGARGDVAAEALVDYSLALHGADYLRPAAVLSHMLGAEACVQEALREVSFAPGAATLAAAWLGSDGRGLIQRVGDCRLYRLGTARIERLTDDQTYAQSGETPPEGSAPDDLAHMVGTGYMGPPQLQPIALAVDSHLLLCSDGLHRGLADQELHAVFYGALAGADDHLSAAVARELCLAARCAGSQDDISALVARRLPPPAGFWRRLGDRLAG